jgi:hypothetical protein
MTEEEQKLLEETVKQIAEQFEVKIQVLRCIDRNKRYKKIVIEYA